MWKGWPGEASRLLIVRAVRSRPPSLYASLILASPWPGISTARSRGTKRTEIDSCLGSRRTSISVSERASGPGSPKRWSEPTRSSVCGLPDGAGSTVPGLMFAAGFGVKALTNSLTWSNPAVATALPVTTVMITPPSSMRRTSHHRGLSPSTRRKARRSGCGFAERRHVHVQAHHGAERAGAQLHQIAELMGDVEPPAAPPIERRRTPPDERILDDAGIAHLADQRVVLLPDAQHALASGVADAVGRRLAHGEHEVVDASGREPGGPAAVGDQRTQLVERAAVEAERVHVAARLCQRRVERREQRVAARIGPARVRGALVDDLRVAATRLVHDRSVKRRAVVRAEQPEVLGVGEGEVEQRLVQLALDELGWAAAGPDRL